MPDILYEKHDNYAIITLNRPERLNALSVNLREELRQAVEDFSNDPDMRAAIVTGAGRAFSAGMDLKEAAERSAAGGPLTQTAFDGTVPHWDFSSNPKPFIAAINGLAVGGGLEAALDCDIRICSTEASFGFFEPRRGIIAAYAANHLPRMINLAAASYMLLTGDEIEAEQALEWGLVSELVEPDELLPRAVEIAQLIGENAPLSVQGSKAEVQAWRMAKIDDNYRMFQWIDRVVQGSEDAKEGARAFNEKRDPVWQGR